MGINGRSTGILLNKNYANDIRCPGQGQRKSSWVKYGELDGVDGKVGCRMESKRPKSQEIGLLL